MRRQQLISISALACVLSTSLVHAGSLKHMLRGGTSDQDTTEAGERYANHIGATKDASDPGVLRCDPFGDFGSFWGITSTKFDGTLTTISGDLMSIEWCQNHETERMITCDWEGKTKKLKKYRGKAVLVVNVASNDPSTVQEFEQLNELAARFDIPTLT